MGKKKAAKAGAGDPVQAATCPSPVQKSQLPKTECCVSKVRCQRCPIRMLKEGTLPEGLTVKKRKLVSVANGKKVSKKKLARAA